ncbi:MAG TPA: hypothetical protein PKB09_03715 [Candidatus Saccharibacteria bacterium]|nr:hypothetical protein [Candidatus Saccharibacteria bacterium]
MKNFLVKMSRNRRIMVPAVTLMALSLGIGGYYVDNQRVLRQEAQQQQNLNYEDENEQVKKAEKTERKDEPSDDDKSLDNSSSSTNGVVQYVVNVEAFKEADTVNVKATIEGSEPGECVITLKQGSYGPETSVSTLGESCEVNFDNPGQGTWNVTAVFTSSDNLRTGSGSTQIEL